MGRRVLDADVLNYISIFESATGAKIKDCLLKDGLTFVVEKGNMGLAIGKGASNLKRVQNILNKQISVIEYDEDVCKFTQNCIVIKDVIIKKEDRKIIITCKDSRTKGKIMGREKTNLANLKFIVSRFFDIEEIVVN